MSDALLEARLDDIKREFQEGNLPLNKISMVAHHMWLNMGVVNL